MTPDRVIAAIDGTWPPARIIDDGAWTFRDGQGGGQRVSATTARGGFAGDIGAAEAGMAEMGQGRLFMIRPGEAGLDAALAERG